MDRKKRIDFLTVVLFLGILLSFLFYIGIGALIGTSPKEANDPFADEFYSDEWMGSISRYIDYRVFHHTDAEHILLGREDWIFDTYDEAHDYHYLLDYVGGCPFSEAELARIARNLERDRQYYAERGAEYLVVVVPSSVTVCREQLPDYLGAQSESTRLSLLSSYLPKDAPFLDATDVMIQDAEEESPYNSTEDSLNAYGAFSLYNLVMSKLNDRPGEPYARIKREELGFSVHMTEGRSAAVSAGLSGIVQNRTVSLIDETVTDRFDVIARREGLWITQWRNRAMAGNASLLLEVSSEWDRIQLMPFFSNTFGTVIYRHRGEPLAKTAAVYAPTLVVRILHENELGELLK